MPGQHQWFNNRERGMAPPPALPGRRQANVLRGCAISVPRPRETPVCSLDQPQAEGRWGLRASCERYTPVSCRTNYCSEGSPRGCEFPAVTPTLRVKVTYSEKKHLPQEESFLEPPPSPLTFSLWKQVGLCSSLGCLGESLAQTLSLQSTFFFL